METMKPLNTTDGWENIVNHNAMHRASARERVAARKRERKLRKLWLSICAMATLSLTFVILGVAGAVVGWLALPVSIVLDMAGCYLLGRYVEMKKV